LTGQLPRRLTRLLATARATEVTIDNYAQPLLHTIGSGLGVADSTPDFWYRSARI